MQALDVGGSGDCFFKAISHQYYGTPDHHIAIRQAGVSYLEQHPDLFIESVADNSWKSYLQRMATPGTWCDNIIIQAVANQLNFVIHIIESRLFCTQGSTINPSTALSNVKVLFVGYIEDLRNVSTIPNSHTTDRNPLYHLKSKLLQSDEKNKKRNQDRRDARQRKRKAYGKMLAYDHVKIQNLHGSFGILAIITAFHLLECPLRDLHLYLIF